MLREFPDIPRALNPKPRAWRLLFWGGTELTGGSCNVKPKPSCTSAPKSTSAHAVSTTPHRGPANLFIVDQVELMYLSRVSLLV